MSYIRDPLSGAVINTDEQYLQAIYHRRNSKKENQSLLGEIDILRLELEQLKQQLHNIIGNNKNG